MGFDSQDNSSNNIKNLFCLTEEQCILAERRICELKEIVSNAISEVINEYGVDFDIYGFLSILSDRINIPSQDMHSDALPGNISRINTFSDSVSVMDRLIICELIIEILRSYQLYVEEDSFLQSSKLPQTFVYAKNILADEAYDVFSQDFSDPRVSYVSGLKEAVRALDGLASYCLMPFEEKGGRRLQTVDELIFRNELKINAVTPVFGFDGLADMKYALLSKGFSKLDRNPDDDRYLEIRLPVDSASSIAQILTVAEGGGLAVYRSETVCFDTDEGNKRFHSIVFRTDKGEFTRLLVYLTLYTENFGIVGIYKNQE